MESVPQHGFLFKLSRNIHYGLYISKSHMEQNPMWKPEKLREETLCSGFVASE